MSYSKIPTTLADVPAAVAEVLANNRIEIAPEQATFLVTNGRAVQLDTGDEVWCASVILDDPDTAQIEFLTVAVAVAETMPARRPNGRLIGTACWRGMGAEIVAKHSINTIRAACLMIALGEPQPQYTDESGNTVDIMPIPINDASNTCIRTQLAVVPETSGDLPDVL